MREKIIAVIGLLIFFCLFFAIITFWSPIKKQLFMLSRYFSERGDLFLAYQNLANPYVRFVKIPAGLRKEEIAMIYKKNLAWNNDDVKEFLNIRSDANLEGRYFPSTYILAANADGESVKQDMLKKFNDNLDQKIKKTNLNKQVVNEETAIKIASLIQREASANDMNLISGIIWNRLWNGMSLDIDATLQYIKGNNQNGWWPQVSGEDRKINSPYNTYINKGLPPSPIANPSLAAIQAAYNPTKTSCLFYFHDKEKQIHCSNTYEEHRALVKEYLGY